MGTQSEIKLEQGNCYLDGWIGGSDEIGGNGAIEHWSDCALHNGPALKPNPCECGWPNDYTGEFI